MKISRLTFSFLFCASLCLPGCMKKPPVSTEFFSGRDATDVLRELPKENVIPLCFSILQNHLLRQEKEGSNSGRRLSDEEVAKIAQTYGPACEKRPVDTIEKITQRYLEKKDL